MKRAERVEEQIICFNFVTELPEYLMALRSLVRPFSAFRCIHSPLPRLVRPYSQPVIKTYENILIEVPKPGVALSMPHSHKFRPRLCWFTYVC